MNRNFNNQYNYMRNPNVTCDGPSVPINRELAMAYVPMQNFGNIYSNDEALNAGTIFKDLYKPFLG